MVGIPPLDPTVGKTRGYGRRYSWLSRSELHAAKNGFDEAPGPMDGCLGSRGSLFITEHI